ncbi:MAG: aminopeptidase [Zetaproteobacteria bacterium]|nr:aminopeptidase [Zetaproteobacteria bacterium]
MIFFVLLGSSGCYLSTQAYHQIKLLRRQRSVVSMLQGPDLPEQLRHRLSFSQRVLAKAKLEGLDVGKAYTTYIDLEGRPVSYLVYAANPLAFKPITWWFPIVGEVRYLGFFDITDRDDKAQSFAAQGLDVYRGQASAFSSLGWFDDPLYSTMVRRSRMHIASTLFHELTHRTIWLPGTAEFNEQLATFVEGLLTVQFLEEEGLVEDAARFHLYQQDYALYYKWQNSLRRELKLVYEDYAADKVNQGEALELKKNILQRYTQQKVPLFKKYNFVGSSPWNNARLLASSLYSPDTSKFQKAYACRNWQNMGEFLTLLKDWASKVDHPEDQLHNFCGGVASLTH